MLAHFNIRCCPPWADEDLALKVKNAYQYATKDPAGVKSVQNEFPDDLPEVETLEVKHHVDMKNNLKKNMYNLKMFFLNPTVLRDKAGIPPRLLPIPTIGRHLKLDLFSHRIIWDKDAPWTKTTREWEDKDAINFKSLLSEQLSIDFSVDLIHEVATVCAQEKAFHPVREYLEGCKWDNVKRLDNWMSFYCGALDCEYSRFVGRKVLIAAVARIMNPGCKFDHVLVTEGSQGIGKSYMWDVLASPWFTDAPLNIHDKGAVEVQHRHDGSQLRVSMGANVETGTWEAIEVPPVPTNYQRFAEAVKTGKMQEPSFRHAAELQKVLDLALVTELERRELPTHG
jgi:hypothetical protein